MRSLKAFLLALLMCSCVLSASAEPRTYRKLISAQAGAIVTVSFSISADMMGQQQRMSGEIEGTVLDGGLILIPSILLNPADLAREMMSQSETPDSEMPTMSTGELKIKVPGIDEPLEAEVLTQDRDFGLAWLRLKNATDLKGISLERARDPVVGETLYGLSLSPELYGYAPYVTRAMVQGEVKVPFPAFMIDAAGKILFNAKGQAVGYAVPKFVDNSLGAFNGEGQGFGLLIPAGRLRELTERARRAKS
jgi:hypothetical protein